MMSERSTCERMKVGAAITSLDYRYVFAIGYNGSAAGDKNGCDRHGQEAVGSCGCIHAEANAVVNCRASREKAKVVFCSHLPCVGCAKLLINLGGVQRVVYRNDYRIKDSLEWFERASIKAVHLPGAMIPVFVPPELGGPAGYACGCEAANGSFSRVCETHATTVSVGAKA
jgi:dCMP deaminase